ncbi:MAG: hypothetical protein RL173_3763, partial [Fibrobacterota bacterium]
MESISSPMASSSVSFTGMNPNAPMPLLFVGHGSPMNAIEDN